MQCELCLGGVSNNGRCYECGLKVPQPKCASLQEPWFAMYSYAKAQLLVEQDEKDRFNYLLKYTPVELHESLRQQYPNGRVR